MHDLFITFNRQTNYACSNIAGKITTEGGTKPADSGASVFHRKTIYQAHVFERCYPIIEKRKIDFALVFAVNQKQLADILKDVVPALQEDAKFWIAYPKLTSKIASDLSRDKNWDFVSDYGFEAVRMIALDNVWSAGRFKNQKRLRKRPFQQHKSCTGH